MFTESARASDLVYVSGEAAHSTAEGDATQEEGDDAAEDGDDAGEQEAEADVRHLNNYDISLCMLL